MQILLATKCCRRVTNCRRYRRQDDKTVFCSECSL